MSCLLREWQQREAREGPQKRGSPRNGMPANFPRALPSSFGGDQQLTWSIVAHARHETIVAYVYGVYHPAAVLAFNVGAFWIWRYTFICTCR